MSFLAGAAIGTLDLETNPFSQGFLQAETLIKTFPSLITSFMANPLLGLADVAGSAMRAVGAAINVGLRGLVSIVRDSAEAADALGDLATSVGVAVEALSGIGLVAQQAGASTDAVVDAFKFLGKNIAEALAGEKEAVATFRDLDVAFQRADGSARPLEDVFFNLADAIAALPDGASRTDVAIKLLGRSGTDLIPTLIQGQNAIREQIRIFEQYGAVVSKRAAESGDAFNDLLGEVKIAWTGIKNQLAEPLREALTPTLRGVLQFIQANQGQIRQQIAGLVNTIIRDLDRIISILPRVASIAVNAIEVVIGAIERLKAILAGAGIGALLGSIIGGSLGGLPGAVVGFRVGSLVGGAAGYGVGGIVAGRTQMTIGPVNIDSLNAQQASSQAAAQLLPKIREAERRAMERQALDLRRAMLQEGGW